MCRPPQPRSCFFEQPVLEHQLGNHLLQRAGLPTQILDLVRGRRPRGIPGQALLASLQKLHGRLTLFREIKERYPEFPVMMVTAYGDDEHRRRASELRAAEFLTKRVDFNHLMSADRWCQLPLRGRSQHGEIYERIGECPSDLNEADPTC